MCFSANASLTSAALLSTTGIISSVWNRSKEHRMIAIIPLLFGVQQAAEGIVWIGVESGSPPWGYHVAVYSFIFFAHVLWPTWLPWSLYKIEPNQKRKKLLNILRVLGVSVSLICLSQLLMTAPTAEVIGHSISYTSYTWTDLMDTYLALFVYGATTLLPFFVSSIRLAHVAGILMVVGLSVAMYIQAETLTSIWCFFASLIALVIAFSVFDRNRKNVFLEAHAEARKFR